MISRRRALGMLAGAGIGSGLTGPAGQASVLAATDYNDGFQAWLGWRATHLDPSGRVVDRLKENASHSEGQGYGMFLASAFNDHNTFSKMWDWTRRNLSRRDDDALTCWLWHPGTPDAPADVNNASDGDLFIAWALLRGAQIFDNQTYFEAAREIAQDLERICVVPMPGRPDWAVLLPGAVGFVDDETESVTLNLSYAFHRPMRELARAFDLPRLELASATNRAIVDRMCEFGLPPDWLQVWAEGMAPAAERPAVFGYEALRIPLFELWSGRRSAPALRRAAELYARDIAAGTAGDGTPTRAALEGSQVLERSPDPGYTAVRSVALCAFGQDVGAPAYMNTPFVAQQNYYPATLHMLAMAADIEAGLQCSAK